MSGTDYAIMDMAYSTAPVFKHGLDEFIHSMVRSRAGAVSIDTLLSCTEIRNDDRVD